MTAPVRLALLGPLEINASAAGQLRRKTRALLVYLAVTGATHSRQHLMSIFCQTANDPPRVLSLLLSRLRRNLGQDIIVTAGRSVRFDFEEKWLDIRDFERTLENAISRQTTDQIQAAITLYRGELAEAISLPDAPQFELWLLGERTRFRTLYERGMAELVGRYSRARQHQLALNYARRLVQSDPLAEEAHGWLMWLYAQTGQREAALQQFEQCRALLQAELAVDPLPELQALRAAVEAGDLDAAVPFKPSESAIEETLPLGSAPFISRADELKWLHDAWNGSQTGRMNVVLVEARAGGGKTRLVEEFSRSNEHTRRATGRGYESAQTIPYHPWVQILETVVAKLDKSAIAALPYYQRAELAQLVPARITEPHSRPGSGQQAQLFHAISEFLLEHAAGRLLFLDDLQWADEASLALFHFFFERLVRRPDAAILLVGAWRSEEAADNPALLTLLDDLRRGGQTVHLALAPFDRKEAARLLEQAENGWSEAELSPEFLDRFWEATGGNPLFVTEMARDLAGESSLAAPLPVPPSLQALIQRRLRRFKENGRQVIEALAILEQPGDFELIRRISGRREEELLEALERGQRWGLVEPLPDQFDRFEFAHDLQRAAVQAALSRVRRGVLHRRAAVALAELQRDPAGIAYHWQQVGDDANEAVFAALAGQKAAEVYANEEAIRHFERVVALRPTAVAWRELGEVQRRSARWNAARHSFNQALSLTLKENDPVEMAICHLALGMLLVVRGNYAEASHHLEEAKRLYEGFLPAPQLADVYNNQAIIAYRQRNFDRALALFEAALEVDFRLEDSEGVAKRTANIGLVHLDRGQFKEAEALLKEALTMGEKLDNRQIIANCLGNLGIAASLQRKPNAALALYDQAIAVEEELGNVQSIARHVGNRGYEFFQKRDLQNALSNFIEALKMERAMGNRGAQSRLMGNLGAIYMDCGNFGTAQNFLNVALGMDLTAKHRDATGRHSGNLGRLFMLQGEWKKVAPWVQPAIVLARQGEDNVHLGEFLLTAARLSQHEGRLSEGGILVEECVAVTEKYNRPDIQLPAQILAVEIQFEQGELAAVGAIAHYESLLGAWPAPHDRARIYHAIWRIDSSREDSRTRAVELFTAAYDSFPLWDYRRAVQELSGRELRLPKLPPPPFELPAAADLEELNAELHDFIDGGAVIN